MTDSIQNYDFNFATEVKDFADFIGTRAENVDYVDVGFDRFRRRIYAANELTGNQQLASYADQERSSDLQKFAEEPGFSSYAKPAVVGDRYGRQYEVGSVLYVNSNQDVGVLFGTNNKDLQLLFTLYHESTHAIAELLEDQPGPGNAHPENLADALAALIFLKRFGQQAVPFLQNLSMGRANMAMEYGDAGHFTSLTLDHIIADSQHEDFTKLSAEQLLQRAQAYAAKWMPDADAVDIIKQVGDEVRESGGVTHGLANWLLSNSSTSGNSPVNMALYAAAKNVEYAYSSSPPVSGRFKPIEMEDSYDAQAIFDRANKMQASALFNRYASQETGFKPAPAPAAEQQRRPSAFRRFLKQAV